MADTAPLTSALLAALDLRDRSRAAPSATYRFTMDNEFVTPTGAVLRRQRLVADYTRRLIGSLSATTAVFGFVWDRVEFSSTSSDTSRTTGQEPIRWTFAEQRGFEYYRPFPTAQFAGDDAGAGAGDVTTDDFRIGDWYSDLARLPSVNLLTMATWDIVMFEAMSGVLACEGLGSYDEDRPIRSMHHNHVHLDFQGYSAAESTFENGAVLGRARGITLIDSMPCAGVSFRGSGRLDVSGHQDGRGQQGESYFLGHCALAMADADLQDAEMTEQLIVGMTNAKGRLVPMQKRRVVRIRKLS